MELLLQRMYRTGLPTNGNLFYNGRQICHTIELPWFNNERNVSCIPEGTYQLNKCFSEKSGWHFTVRDVTNRTFIAIHPANDAFKELRGCIAPVSDLLRTGVGTDSSAAMKLLTDLAFPEIKKGNIVYLTITSSN
jgi:hypothetical protein